MSLLVNYRSALNVVETLEGPFVDPADATVRVNGLDTASEPGLGAESTPPCTKQSADNLAMVEGAGEIDLTALPDLNGEGTDVDGTGLKVQLYKFINKPDNSGAITIEPGAEDGYNIFGADGQVTLGVGEEIMALALDTRPDIASNAKVLTISGTGSDVLEFHLVMG
jgi:hypothetical protein